MNKFIIAEVVFIVSSFAFPFLKSLKEALIGDKVIWKIGLDSFLEKVLLQNFLIWPKLFQLIAFINLLSKLWKCVHIVKNYEWWWDFVAGNLLCEVSMKVRQTYFCKWTEANFSENTIISLVHAEVCTLRIFIVVRDHHFLPPKLAFC